MKYFILFILLLSSVTLAAQSTLPLRADTVVVEKTGGSGELKIKNSTRDSLGLLVNIGGGRTRFIKAKKLTDSTFIIGLDTLLIRGKGTDSTIYKTDGSIATLRTINFAGTGGLNGTNMNSLNFSGATGGFQLLANATQFLMTHFGQAPTKTFQMGDIPNQGIKIGVGDANLFIDTSDRMKFTGLKKGEDASDSMLVYRPSDGRIGYRSIPTGGGGGTPGGSTTQIQYNSSGVFAGDAGLTYNATTNKVTTDSINVLTQNFDTLRRSVTGLYGRDTLYWFGDSHTTGTGATVTGRRYSTQTSAFLGYVEKNLGAGGTLMQGNSTIIPNIPYKSASTPGSKLVINFGTNDGIFRDGAPGTYDTTTFKTDYIRWIDSAIARGWTAATDILIVQMEYSTLSGIQAEWLDYKRATQTVAETKGTLFIPTWDLMLSNAGAGFVSSDGFHPNDAGYSYTASLIINKLRGSVKGNDQAVAINGLVEVQNLRMRNMDSSGYTSRVVEADSLGYFRLAQSNKYIHNNSSTTNLDAAAIGISNMGYSATAWRSPRLELTGTGSARDLGAAGINIWNDGTGGHFASVLWPAGTPRNTYINEFNGSVQIGAGTINTNGRLSVGGNIVASGTMQAAAAFSTNSIASTQMYYASAGYGGLQAYNHPGSAATNLALNEFGGEVWVGSGADSGAYKLQVTNGESIFSQKIKLGANRSFNNQGLNGLFFHAQPAIYTDNNTAISGTVAHVTGASFFAPTLAASSSSVTFTNASTLYVSGAPAAGSNVTLTNPWAFHVAAGAVKLGDWSYDGTTVKQNNATAATSITSSTAIGSSSGGDIRLLAGPTPTAADQRLGGVMFGTLDGGSTENLTASIEGYSTAAHTPGSSEGTHLRFLTTAVATRTEVMRITANLRVGIGVTSPGASLHLRAGNSSSGGAPFMFTSGTNLATPAAGAMEYDGTSFFATPGSTRLRKVLTNNSIPTNGQIPIGDGANYTNATLTQGDGITITNGAGSITVAVNGTSGFPVQQYTPTYTGLTNITGIATSDLYYQRIGMRVYVWGTIGIDPTSVSTLTEVAFDLPVASTFANISVLSGSGQSDTIAQGIALKADNVNHRGIISFFCTDASSANYFLNFSYQVTPP